MRNDRRLFYLLTIAQRAVYKAIERESLARLGVTPAQLGLLYCLDPAAPRPLADVARSLDLKPAGASGLVDRTVEAGLIERVPSDDDGRAVKLRILRKGLAVRDKSKRHLDGVHQRLTEGLDDGELAAVLKFLNGLVERFGADARKGASDV